MVSNVLVTGNTITNNKGVATDGSDSAGILVDTAFAPGTQATIIGNTIHDNDYGIFVGVQFPDSDSSTVVAQYNNIFNNSVGAFSSNPTVNATHNWWGSTSGPQNASSNPNGTGNPVNNLITFSSFGTGPKQVLTATSVADYLAKTNDLFATGADQGGGPHVKVYNNDGTLRFSFFAYAPKFPGGVRVATADVNGDGVDDIITGAGPGGGPHVEVFDGTTGNLIRSFFAYASNFSGGVFVAAGDVNGDGKADIITGTGAGVITDVRVFDGATGNLIDDFQPYNAGFTGGVTVAAGDVSGDGKADIITGAGPGGGPHVEAFDGVTLTVLRSFFAYDQGFMGGVNVAGVRCRRRRQGGHHHRRRRRRWPARQSLQRRRQFGPAKFLRFPTVLQRRRPGRRGEDGRRRGRRSAGGARFVQFRSAVAHPGRTHAGPDRRVRRLRPRIPRRRVRRVIMECGRVDLCPAHDADILGSGSRSVLRRGAKRCPAGNRPRQRRCQLAGR